MLHSFQGNDSLLPCSPRDILLDLYTNRTTNPDNDNVLNKADQFSDPDQCPYDCVQVRHHTKVTQGKIDTGSLATFLPGINGQLTKEEAEAAMAEQAKHSTLLHFYFDSFEYPTYTLYRLTILDFLCKW